MGYLFCYYLHKIKKFANAIFGECEFFPGPKRSIRREPSVDCNLCQKMPTRLKLAHIENMTENKEDNLARIVTHPLTK